MANFLSSFGKSLIDPNLTDAAIEVAESSLDDILDCPAVDDIPVLRSIIGIGKTIVGIRERTYFVRPLSSSRHSMRELYPKKT